MADFDAITLAQFWGRVTVSDTASCWEWRGPFKSNGYGRFEDARAHRIAYELVKGPIPDGLLVRHICDNRRCCNPNHLLVGTHADNSNDAVERGRLSRGERHPRTKLTADQVRYIRQNPDRLTGRQLAEQFGMSQSSISYIRSGRSWQAA